MQHVADARQQYETGISRSSAREWRSARTVRSASPETITVGARIAP
jgi:hypothetical protein